MVKVKIKMSEREEVRGKEEEEEGEEEEKRQASNKRKAMLPPGDLIDYIKHFKNFSPPSPTA